MSNLSKFNSTIVNQQWQDYLHSVLREKKNSFVNNIVALVSNDAKLQECNPSSIIYAAIKSTVLDLPLDPNLGFCYIVPFKNNKENKTEAQFMCGYKGFKQLAIRSGQFKKLHSTDVREGEIVNRNRLTGEMEFNFIQNDTERMSKKIIGFVSYFELVNGFSSTLYMSVEELKAHGLKYSQTYKSTTKWVSDNSKWNTDFEAMALKTVTKLNLSKNAPLSVEMQSAIISDQAVLNEKGQRYIDNEPDAETSKRVADIFEKAIQDVEVVADETPETTEKTIFNTN